MPGRLHAATLETSGRLFGLCKKHVSRLFGCITVLILYTLSVQVHVQSERSRRLRAGTKLFRVTKFKSKMPFLGLLNFKMYLVVCRVLRSGGGWGSGGSFGSFGAPLPLGDSLKSTGWSMGHLRPSVETNFFVVLIDLCGLFPSVKGW